MDPKQEIAALKLELKQKGLEYERSRRALLHMMADLEKANRVKDEFISIVSHELRTPLAPIIDYVAILKEGLAPDQTQAIYDRLSVCAKRELNLVNSLLDVSRLESGMYNPVKVMIYPKKVITDLLQEFSLEIKKKKLKVSAQMGEETLLADENLLVRAISQLIDNAIKFSPKGGHVQVRSFFEDGKIRFEIGDQGIGIAPENLEKIFDKFFQVDSSYTRKFGGMGLGLTIVKQIIESHGGKIWAVSRGLGHGAKFIFLLPVA